MSKPIKNSFPKTFNRMLLWTALGCYLCMTAGVVSAESARLQVVTYADTFTAAAMNRDDYTRVIRMARSNATHLGFADLTNVCAAHILRGDYDTAVRACDRAISYRPSPSVLQPISHRGARWAAYANRALARELGGDRAGARRDLMSAIRLDGTQQALVHNLAVITARSMASPEVLVVTAD